MKKKSIGLVDMLSEEFFSNLKSAEQIASNEPRHIQRASKVEVKMSMYKIAQNVFDALHADIGKRVDSNVWEFPDDETARDFIESLELLGIKKSDILFAQSYVDKFLDELDKAITQNKEATSEEGGQEYEESDQADQIQTTKF